MPDMPPSFQFAFVCGCGAVQVTLCGDSLIRGPPALTSADSSKSLPVAVDLVDVASVSGSVTVVVHDDVPPPKVMPVFVTFWAVALVGPSTEHLPWTGTLIATSPLVNSAEPIWATPGCGAACAGAAVTASPAKISVPASAPRLAMVLRMSRPPCRPGRATLFLELNIRPPGTSVAPETADHPFVDHQPPIGGPTTRPS